MFVNISSKKLGDKFLDSMSKNFEMSAHDYKKYNELYKTKEMGVFASYTNIELNIDLFKYELIPDIFHELAVILPKSIKKREKRKFSRRGMICLKNSNMMLNHYKDMVSKNNDISEIDRKNILKNIRSYSILRQYGVADNEFQVKKHFNFLERSKQKYVIIMSPVWRENQPEQGGFRYHKHGQYIGKQDIKNEYLFDDKHIEKVFLFQIYEVKEKEKNDFFGHKYIMIDNYIFNKKEEVVAILIKRNRKIVCGYMEKDESIIIPDNVNIDVKEEFYSFLDKHENFLN